MIRFGKSTENLYDINSHFSFLPTQIHCFLISKAKNNNIKTQNISNCSLGGYNLKLFL
jgi:hypothetical protein